MQSVKKRLIGYLEIVAHNDREIARYEELDAIGTTEPEKLKEIKDNIIESTNKEIAEKEYIKELISKLPSLAQQQLLTYRYIDRLDWNVVVKIMFHTAEDFEINFDKYKRKVFKLHNKAIKKLDELESKQ